MSCAGGSIVRRFEQNPLAGSSRACELIPRVLTRYGEADEQPDDDRIDRSSRSVTSSAGRAHAGRGSPERQSSPKVDREQQFLDVACDLIRERGLGSITMERLAVEAGVSKALPYRYFENTDAVFVALYVREIGRLSDRIAAAMRSAPPGGDLLRVAVREYFRAVDEHGAVLGALAGPGSPIVDLVRERGATVDNRLARYFAEFHRVPPKQSLVLSSMVSATVIAANECVARGEVTRPTAEKAAVAAVAAMVEALGRG